MKAPLLENGQGGVSPTSSGGQSPIGGKTPGQFADTNPSPISPGLLCMLMGAFLFSVMALMVKYLKDFGTYELVFWRSLFMSFMTLAYIAVKGIPIWGPEGKACMLIIRGLLGYGFMVGYYYAIEVLPLADAVVINYTMPVITAIGAAIFLKEKWEKLDALGSVLCFTGVLLVSKPAFVFQLFGEKVHELPPAGVFGALSAAVMSSGVYLMVRMLRGTHPVIFVNYFALVGVVMGPICMQVFGEEWVWPKENKQWGMLILLALVSVIGQGLMNVGLSMETAAKATAMNYIQVVFAAIFQYYLFGVGMDTMSICGCTLIAMWGVIALLKESVGKGKVQMYAPSPR